MVTPHTTYPDHRTLERCIWSLANDLPPTLTLPPEFEAVPFFFKNFALLPQQAESMRGYLELLVPLHSQARPSSALHLATDTVALAVYGNYPGRDHLLQGAMKMYGKALKKLNEDLTDPMLSKSDESILATLILSLYEVSSQLLKSSIFRSALLWLSL